MTNLRKLPILLLFTLIASLMASAESKNELGLLIGATVVPDQTINSSTVLNGKLKFSKGVTYQATYARRLLNAGIAGVDFELPFLGTPNADISSNDLNTPTALASLFITPALRVKLFPNAGISPWVSVGGGYGRFDEGSKLQSGAANFGPKGTNTGVFEYGGGIDIHVISLLSLRGEVRDFYSGRPQFNVLTQNDRQHNIVVSGGFVVHF
ncbi:MAG TPA: hypothetical protein VFA68_02925 [Terriglobales bacterium]|nr:hypothetical protein [Terriglobales bacterium]